MHEPCLGSDVAKAPDVDKPPFADHAVLSALLSAEESKRAGIVQYAFIAIALPVFIRQHHHIRDQQFQRNSQ